MDTCPFWETVMMCSLADMALLYGTSSPLYVSFAPDYSIQRWGRHLARPYCQEPNRLRSDGRPFTARSLGNEGPLEAPHLGNGLVPAKPNATSSPFSTT